MSQGNEPLSEREYTIAAEVVDRFNDVTLFYYSEKLVRYYLAELYGYKKDNATVGKMVSEVNRLRMIQLGREYPNHRTMRVLKDPVR